MNRFQLKHPLLAALFALATVLAIFELLAVLCMNQGPHATKQSVRPLPVTLGDCVKLGTVENGRLVGFSPNGNTLAVVREGGWTSAGPIRLWDVRSGKEKGSVGEGWDQIQMVHFSPDSTMIAVYDTNNGIGVWDIATGNQRDAFKPRTFFGNCVSFWFSPDSKSLIYKHFAENFPHDEGDQLFNIRDIGAGRDRATIVGEPWLFEFSPDGTRIATGTSAARGVKRRVMLWAWAGGQPPVLLRDHSVRADSVAFSHSLDSFATANTTGQARDTTEIQIVDMNTGHTRLTFTYTDEETHIQEISFSRDEKLLIANGGGGHQLSWTTRSTLWDIRGTAARKIGSYPVEPGVSSDAGVLAVQSLTGRSEVRVSLVEVATGQEKGALTQTGDVTGSFVGTFNNLKSYASIAFSPDGRVVIVWRLFTDQKRGGYNVARIWQVEPLKELETLYSCHDLSFSPDRRTLVVLTGNGSLRLWRLASSRC
ncbi:MAG: hypothetical protein C0467_32565 [Planctomycetaceae bacterium]|nr:hypothetical protein [Planctomycetaceae bacterium]